MIGKIVKYSGITFALLALISLRLPMFSTYITDGEACNMVVNGYNLIEFSHWGSIVLLVPLVMLGLVLSKLKNGIKTIGLLSLFLLVGVALFGAVSAAYDWISGIATGFVNTYMSGLMYVLCLFLAMVCFWILCNFSSDKLNIKNLLPKEEDSEE